MIFLKSVTIHCHSFHNFVHYLKELIIREDPFGKKRCLKDVSKDKFSLYSRYFGAVYSATVSYIYKRNNGTEKNSTTYTLAS